MREPLCECALDVLEHGPSRLRGFYQFRIVEYFNREFRSRLRWPILTYVSIHVGALPKLLSKALQR